MVIVYAALAFLPALVVGARQLTGIARDLQQAAALVAAGVVCWERTEDWLLSCAAAGMALAVYTVWEWVTASSDAAKTTVISRHTGRRLPPI